VIACCFNGDGRQSANALAAGDGPDPRSKLSGDSESRPQPRSTLSLTPIEGGVRFVSPTGASHLISQMSA
jgi:hypothetical protein